jgi:hypothetical protein
VVVLYENIHVAQSCVSNYSSYAICELRFSFLNHNGPHNFSVKKFAAEHPHDEMTQKYLTMIKSGRVVNTPGVSSTTPWRGPVPAIVPPATEVVDLNATPQTPPGTPPAFVVPPNVVLRFTCRGPAEAPINPGPGCMPNPDGNWKPQGSEALFPPTLLTTNTTRLDNMMNVIQTVVNVVKDMDARLAIVQGVQAG